MSEVSGLGKLVEALAKAKAHIKPPAKTKTGKVSGTSKSGKSYEYEYKYADRADVIEAYRAALATEGLILSHGVETVGDALNMVLASRLIHSGGGEIVSRIPIPQTKDAQSLGSWLTYLERYASCALLDIAAEDDDDGQRAGSRNQKKREPVPPVRQSAPPVQTQIPAYECVTDEQVEVIHNAAKAAGLKTLGELKGALLRLAGTDVSKHIPADRYEHVIEQLALLKATA